LGNVIAGQLQWALVADGGLGVVGEGGEAVEFFKDGQVTLGMGDRLKATEVLVMLVEAGNDTFDRVVGFGDERRADAVGESRPMVFQEVKDGGGLGLGVDVVLTQG